MVNISEIYPNEAERVMFLRGLIRLAKADGVLEPEEVVFFDAAVQGLGVSVTVGAELRQILLDDIFTSPYLEMQFAKPAQGLFFIREAMQCRWRIFRRGTTGNFEHCYGIEYPFEENRGNRILG